MKDKNNKKKQTQKKNTENSSNRNHGYNVFFAAYVCNRGLLLK